MDPSHACVSHRCSRATLGHHQASRFETFLFVEEDDEDGATRTLGKRDVSGSKERSLVARDVLLFFFTDDSCPSRENKGHVPSSKHATKEASNATKEEDLYLFSRFFANDSKRVRVRASLLR